MVALVGAHVRSPHTVYHTRVHARTCAYTCLRVRPYINAEVAGFGCGGCVCVLCALCAARVLYAYESGRALEHVRYHRQRSAVGEPAGVKELHACTHTHTHA